MPFSRSRIDELAGSLATPRAIEFLHGLRRNATIAYGLSIIAIALAFVSGIAVGAPIIAEIPFGPFYPAILLSAFIGGFGPAAVALACSSVIAWFYFLPPEWPVTTEIVALSMFVLVNGMNIGLVMLLQSTLRRVVAGEHEVRTLMETAHNGIVLVDNRGTITLVNRRTEQLFGYTRNELVGKSVGILVPEQRVDKHNRLCATYMGTPQTRAMGLELDVYGRRKDGTAFPAEIALNGYDQQGGKIVLATVVDISERKKAAAQQELLTRELHHRIQNLFAVVQSLIRRSLRDDTSSKHDLLNRLQALSRAHSLLAHSAWEGAELDQILKCELDAFAERAVVNGCDLVITPAAAQTFCLIVHELVTNAAKYGALSVPTGNVAVVGAIEHEDGKDVFRLRWVERNGPEVKVSPRRGFGSTVLIDAAEAFGARPRIDYAREGLRYELLVPLQSIQALHKEAGSRLGAGGRQNWTESS